MMINSRRQRIETRHSSWLYMFAIIICFQAGAVFSQEDTSHPVGNVKAAFDRVLQYTGLDREILLPEGQRLEEWTEKVVMTDTTVAFARKHINNRTAWHLSFQDIMLPDTAHLTMDWWTPLPRTMEFWVDSTTGRLLLVRSVRQDDEKSCEPPWSEVFSPHLFAGEKFLGPAIEMPRVTLRQALTNCFSYPFSAKEWRAALVTYSKLGQEPVEAWVMNFSGLNNQSMSGIPMAYARVVVEASAASVLMHKQYAIDLTVGRNSGE